MKRLLIVAAWFFILTKTATNGGVAAVQVGPFSNLNACMAVRQTLTVAENADYAQTAGSCYNVVTGEIHPNYGIQAGGSTTAPSQ